ncbi:MAG: hypothetical protein ACJ75B_08190 [Flavisolibacter sp.]
MPKRQKTVLPQRLIPRILMLRYQTVSLGLSWPKENGTWQSRYFDIDNLPKPSMAITSLVDVYQRNRVPKQLPSVDNWFFGDKIGVLKKGTKVTVLKTVT